MTAGSLLIPDPRQMFADADRRLGILERRVREPDPVSRQKAPIITVAAVDTPATQAAGATYACNGSNDQNQIQEAVAQAAASGGMVLLLGGTFTLSASIVGASSASIMGSGPETVVVAPSGDYAFKTASGQGPWSISNLAITVASGATGGISAAHGGPLTLADLIITGVATSAGRGIHANVEKTIVIGCRLSTLQYGFYGDALGDRFQLIGNRVTNSGTGIYFDSSVENIIAGNRIDAIQGHGIQGVSGCNDNNIYGNTFQNCGLAANNTYSGIHIAGFRNYIHSNVFRADAANEIAYAFTVAAFYSDNWIAMNDAYGAYVTGILNDLSGNTITFPGNRPFAAGSTTLGHTVKDEGTPLTARAAINFVGDSVVATDDAANNETDVTISHLAGGVHTAAQPVTVRKNSGADIGTRPRLNLIEGTNVTLTVADDAAGGEVDVTIAAAGGGGGAEMVPYYLAAGETFTVPEFRQALYVETIELDGGTLDIEGLLIEVLQPPDLSALVHMGA